MFDNFEYLHLQTRPKVASTGFLNLVQYTYNVGCVRTLFSDETQRQRVIQVQRRFVYASSEEMTRKKFLSPLLNLLSSRAGDQLELGPCQAWAGVGDVDGQSCLSSCPGYQEGTRTGTSH